MASPTTRDEHLQFRAAQLLAQGLMQAQIAAEVGVRPETISRWKCDSANFQAELEAAKKLVRSRFRRQTCLLVDAAIKSAAGDCSWPIITSDEKPALLFAQLESKAFGRLHEGGTIFRDKIQLGHTSAVRER